MGWEFEPLIHERPAQSEAEDASTENKLVEDTESNARPADDESKTDRSGRQPGKETASTGTSVDRQCAVHNGGRPNTGGNSWAGSEA